MRRVLVKLPGPESVTLKLLSVSAGEFELTVTVLLVAFVMRTRESEVEGGTARDQRLLVSHASLPAKIQLLVVPVAVKMPAWKMALPPVKFVVPKFKTGA